MNVGEDGRLEASTLGEVAARKGIRAATALKLARFFETAQGRAVPELELFYELSLTEDGQRMHVPLSAAEHRGRSVAAVSVRTGPHHPRICGELARACLSSDRSAADGGWRHWVTRLGPLPH